MEFSAWNSFLYLYGVGGVLFFGVIILALKKNVIGFQKSQDKKLLFGFIFAFFLYAGVHALWNIAAIGAMK